MVKRATFPMSSSRKTIQVMKKRIFIFEALFPNTEMCVDLKLLTHKPGRLCQGETISGAVTRDGEEHFTFVEDAMEKKTATEKRNPIVYSGLRVNVHRKDDGTLYPTFNRPVYTEKFTFRDFCCEAAEELLAVASLVKK